MVFQTVALFIRSKGPDEFWRKRKIFKLAAHFYGRKRNCYSIAIRSVHRALVNATKGRKLKKLDMAELWTTRITAATEEHGLPYVHFREGLHRSSILLNRKTLSELAVFEPFSFRALTQIAWTKMRDDGDREVKNLDAVPPTNVYLPPSSEDN